MLIDFSALEAALRSIYKPAFAFTFRVSVVSEMRRHVHGPLHGGRFTGVAHVRPAGTEGETASRLTLRTVDDLFRWELSKEG